MIYKAKCIKSSKESAIMFIEGEDYSVKKYSGNVFLKYVSVTGTFIDSHGNKFEAERLFEKKTCEKHLQII